MDDDDVTVAADGESAGHPNALCNDRFPTRVISVGPQPVEPHDAVFQNGYRTASGVVFLSGPSDVLFPVPPLRAFLRRRPAQSAGRPQSIQPGSVAGLSDGGLQPVMRAAFPAQ